MVAIIAFFLGAIIGAALFGALFAWIIRKIFKRVTLRQSYILGLAPVPLLAGFTNAANSIAPGYAGTFIVYALAALVAYFLLVATGRSKAGK